LSSSIEAPAADDLRAWGARIAAARATLDGVAHRTPVVTSRTLDARTGARASIKCENLQRMGAFKFRGAWNAISRLEGDAARGVVTYSSGNHAQAVALACRERGLPCAIVMPSTAPAAKLEATRGYGAELVHHDTLGEQREPLAERLAAERGWTLVPPFDHPDIVAGQATATAELLEQAGTLDMLLVPCGGGGLLSGAALAAAIASPGCRVIGVEPATGDDGNRSFREGRLVTIAPPRTIADGARTPSLGRITFPLVRRYVHDMVTATDDQLIDTMAVLAGRLKLVVEPTGALAAAAVLHGIVRVEGKRVGIVLSGGNVELSQLARWTG
jgi:threonine dehydratase